ncbi:MAG: T9SS type A sorting domain-containing protein [Bacteroidota bacterium]
MNLTGLKFNTTGTYIISELDSFFLWYNITNDINSASLLISGLDSVPGSQTFPAFSRTLVANDTSFLWITCNTLQAAAPRTIQVLAMDTSNFKMAAGTKTGTSSLAGVQTISQSVPAPTGNSNQSFCTPPSPTVANLIATGNTIQWYPAASGGSPLASITALTDNTHYFATQTVGGCVSTSRFDVTVTIVTSPASPTGNANQTFCTPPNPTVAGLVATGTSIQWYSAANGGAPLLSTVTLSNNTHYFATQTVGGCESTSRFDVTASVVATPTAPSGNANQSFCTPPNPTVANLTATGNSIQWYSAASGGSPLANNFVLTNNTHYFASQTVGGCESTLRFDVTVTIGATPSAPTGSATQSFCSVSTPTVADLIATGTAIQWYSAANGGPPLLSTVNLTDGTHYFASQTVGGCESTSRLDVTVTIVTNPAAPTGDPTQLFCTPPNPTIADLTATGIAIQWYAASSGGLPLLNTTVLTNNTHYFATQTLNGSCESISRFDVLVTINPTPSAPTGNSPQSFCSATNSTVANLLATGTSLQWYDVSTGGTALASADGLINNSHYFASQTVNGCESTSRLDVTVTIITTPSAPTGNSTQLFCSVSNPNVGNLVATGTAIQWYLNSSGGTAQGANTPLTNNTHYFASQTVNGCESTSRLDIAVTIFTTPSAPSGNSNQSFCSATNSTIANLSAVGTAIQWYAASSGGSPLSWATPLTDGAHYFATQTINGLCESTTRLDVTITIIQNPNAPTGSSTQSFCGASNATLFNVTTTGTAIHWYATSNGGVVLPDTTALINNTHYFATQTINGCESTTRLNITVEVRSLTSTAGINASVCAGLPVTLTANNIANGFPPYNVTWDNNADSCSLIPENANCSVEVVPLVSTVFTATVTDAQSCVIRVNQSVTVKALPAHVTVINPYAESLDATVCGGSRNLSYSLNTSMSSTITWTSVPSSVIIGDNSSINNLITFPDSASQYDAIITIRIDSINGCSDTTTFMVHVTADDAPLAATIVKKDIGNGPILIYTDPDVRGYRWGYDKVNLNSRIIETKFVTGQVYQAFVPTSEFLTGSELDTVNFWYWVMVYSEGSANDTCKTRIYYNGDFRQQVLPLIEDAIIARIVPSPNNGDFSLMLQGNLYGDVTLKVYDNLGRQKLIEKVTKTSAQQYFPLFLADAASGLYLAVMTGENGEKVIVKFIVKN